MLDNNAFEDYCEWIKQEFEFIGIQGTQSQFPIKNSFFMPQGSSKIKNNLNTSFDIVEYIDTSNKIIIRGEAGTGKSTLSRYLIFKYLDKGFIPFFVRLFDIAKYIYANKINELTVKGFIHYMCSQEELFALDINEDNIENQFKKGKTLLILDGFDEIDNQSHKDIIIQFFHKLLLYKNIKKIITSRPYAIVPYINNLPFDIVDIDFLDYDDIYCFIDKLYRNNNWNGTGELNPDDLLDIIKSNNNIYQFARIPALLTCLCIVFFNGISVPNNKNELFDVIVNYLLPSNEKQLYIKLYSSIAFLLCQDERKVKLDNYELLNKMSELDIPYSDLTIKKELESGIIISRTKGTIEFWHPFFQDYFYAKYLFSLPAETVKFNLLNKIGNPVYSESICFYIVFLLESGIAAVNNFLDYICKKALEDRSQTIYFANLLKRIFENLYAYDYSYQSRIWEDMKKVVDEIIQNEGRTNLTTLEYLYNASIAIGMQEKDFSSVKTNYVELPGSNDFQFGSQNYCIHEDNYDQKSTEFEQPVSKVNVPSFEILSSPVLVGQFASFVNDNAYQNDKFWSIEGLKWKKNNNIVAPREWEQQIIYKNLPVSGVSWYEALAYCNWLSSFSDSYYYELPTEVMWEYAYKYGSGYSIYHFGNNISRGTNSEVNWSGAGLGRKSPIGLFPLSKTSIGIYDLIGNVEEWCLDDWRMNHDIACQADETGAVVKGGSCVRVSVLCRPTYRSRSNKTNRYLSIGFRIVRRKK